MSEPKGDLSFFPMDVSGFLPISQYTPGDVLAKMRTVDGHGSDLDACKLDGVEGANYHQKELTAAPGSPWGAPTIYLRDSLRASVEAASGGKTTVLYDDQGNPSYMVVVPKFNIEDIDSGSSMGTGVHPAFVVGGVEKPYIMVGQVPASQGAGGRAVAIPGRDPWCSINFDGARAACTAKGAGWHMLTAWEWAAIALWSMKNGTEPRGNTEWGRAHDARWETAPRQDSLAPGLTSGAARNRGGLGPARWRHDWTFAGIADLVGNVWEWTDGLKLVEGAFYYPDDNAYALAEASWPAAGPTTSNLGAGSGTTWNAMPLSTAFDGLTAAQKQRAARLMVAPKAASGAGAIYATKGGYWCQPTGERLLLRGGDWSSGSHAGLAALGLGSGRSLVGGHVGFRPAFIP